MDKNKNISYIQTLIREEVERILNTNDMKPAIYRLSHSADLLDDIMDEIQKTSFDSVWKTEIIKEIHIIQEKIEAKLYEVDPEKN